MINHILIDLKAALKSFYRNKNTIFWSIAFPMVIMLLFGAIFSQSSTKYDLYLQNQDLVNGKATFWSNTLITVLNSTNAFNIYFVDNSINGTNYAIANRLNNLLIIPRGFNDTANIAIFTHGAIKANMTLVYDQSTSSSSIVTSIVKGIIDKFNFELSKGINYLNIEDLTIAPTRFSFIDFFLPGVIGMTVMTTSIFTSVSVSARFKENGIFHKLATTPIKRYEWILSRTIYNILISFLGTTMMIFIGIGIFHLRMTLNLVSLLMIVSTSLLFSGLGMIIARFVKDPDSADSAANVITFPMMFLSGTFFPLSQMPSFLQTIAQVLPLTYVNEGLRAAMIFGQQQQAIYNTAIISILGIALIAVGSFITKWEED